MIGAMKPSRPDWRIEALAILFAAAPLAFAVIRAVRTGYDLRYLWVALAALLGTTVVMAVGKTSKRSPHAAVALSAAAFVVATLLAVLAAWLLGTRVGPGLLVVASAFGFCCATSCLLRVLARQRAERLG